MSRCTVAIFVLLVAFTAGVQSGDAATPEWPSTAHKDQYFRSVAIDLYAKGEIEEARHYFTLAARYADKPSQLALALMAMGTDGGTPDLPLAYAWLDVAAERGYPAFLAERERLWSRMDEEQRQRALAIGRQLLRVYGDHVAKERHWRRVLAHARGSMYSKPSLRHVARVDQYAGCNQRARTLMDLNGAGGCSSLAGFFDDANWDADAYWQLQDSRWRAVGTVSVGPLQLPDARQ